MQNIKLRDGYAMQTIAYGTWKIENGQPTVEAVKNAIKCGYRHIDTAAAYGNDFAVGKAIKNSGIPREEMFITNKLWNAHRGYEEAIAACKKTLRLMKLDYLDAYLIHWPASYVQYKNWKEINLNTWRGLEQLKKEGLVLNIGVSNFEEEHLLGLIENDARPFLNQFEMHIGKNRESLIAFCKEKGIVTMAWSPLGRGTVLEHIEIKKMAKKYNKTEAQICLRYCIEKGMAVVTRSVKIERMYENMYVFDFLLEKKEMEVLDEIVNYGESGLNPNDIELEKKLSAL